MNTEPIGMGDGLSVLRFIFSLILVMAVMFGIWLWLRRRGASCFAGRRIRIIERLPLDTRRSMMIVNVDGQEVLVGVTNEQITHLTDLCKKEETDETE